MASTAIRRMLSTPSPSVTLLVLPLPSLWAVLPKPIVVPLCHLVDQCLSPTLAPPMVSLLLTPWVTPLRPSLECLCFPLIPLLASPVGSPSLSSWVTSLKPKAAQQQFAIADRSTSTSNCVGKTRLTAWCSHVMRNHRCNHLSSW
jgi:hypothetical protein